jgi:hypothetical protein
MSDSDINDNKNIAGNFYSIHDAKVVFVELFLCSVIIGGLSYFTFIAILSSAPIWEVSQAAMVTAVILVLLCDIYWLMRFIAFARGIKINLNTYMMVLPESFLQAHSFFSYFNPRFLLRAAFRKTIDLKKVTRIQTYQSAESAYKVNLVGTFGAFDILFNNEGKCQEFYAMIVQLNEMGDPMIVRD